MIQNLERIEYRKGLLEKGMKAGGLPVKVWRGARIPADVRKAINEEDLLNLGGVYGDKSVGDPVEYDNLYMGLPDAGGDDHRPLEPVHETVPFRDLLLWAEKLFLLPIRTQTQSAGSKRHVLHRRGLGRRGRHLAPGPG